jgi:type III pantothenate kinase
MNIIIDIGNTSCKIAFVSGDKIVDVKRVSDIEDIFSIIPFGVEQICYSSVREKNVVVESRLKSICNQFILFDLDYVKRKLKDINESDPLNILDNMPDGMGADRMAAILGAHLFFKNQDILLFDFGTATTVEFIDKRRYLGGAISLGLNTRYRALSYFTAKLPYLNPLKYLESVDVNSIDVVGYDLDTAMASGNILGIIFEIEGYMKSHPHRTVILTGGDAISLAKRVSYDTGREIYVVNDLVLLGLVHITKYGI